MHNKTALFTLAGRICLHKKAAVTVSSLKKKRQNVNKETHLLIFLAKYLIKNDKNTELEILRHR
jgi:hypothetical protein